MEGLKLVMGVLEYGSQCIQHLIHVCEGVGRVCAGMGTELLSSQATCTDQEVGSARDVSWVSISINLKLVLYFHFPVLELRVLSIS